MLFKDDKVILDKKKQKICQLSLQFYGLLTSVLLYSMILFNTNTANTANSIKLRLPAWRTVVMTFLWFYFYVFFFYSWSQSCNAGRNFLWNLLAPLINCSRPEACPLYDNTILFAREQGPEIIAVS